MVSKNQKRFCKAGLSIYIDADFTNNFHELAFNFCECIGKQLYNKQ